MTNLAICYFSIFSSFQKLIFKHLKKWNQTKSWNLPQWCICCLVSSFKKGGKIQTGLNCEYDGLSKVVLTLSHPSKTMLVCMLGWYKVY